MFWWYYFVIPKKAGFIFNPAHILTFEYVRKNLLNLKPLLVDAVHHKGRIYERTKHPHFQVFFLFNDLWYSLVIFNSSLLSNHKFEVN